MPPDDLVLTEHAQLLISPRGLIVLVDEPINTTRALRTDQGKEEEFASIIEVSEAYTGIYEYLQLLLYIGSRLLRILCLLVG